ncbi:MAG TPA: LLM class flavin-dependent oxidoreductase, partial [Solirubrobacteraceae bacterium]|nr:LLM class flavin-dependent oxidoreductase [Solirubrobacteraceae bacterium]
AAELGLPYSFADFINPGGAEIAALYREQCLAAEPRVMVAAWVICAETDEEAQRLASSSRMTLTLLRQGRLIAVPPVEKALRFLESQGPAPGGGRRAVIGSPPAVRAKLEQLASDYGAEEAMIVTITHSHEARRRSYELIAEAFADVLLAA